MKALRKKSYRDRKEDGFKRHVKSGIGKSSDDWYTSGDKREKEKCFYLLSVG